MELKLQAKSREVTGKKVEELRAEKMIPAVIYGHGIENKNIVVDYIPFEKLYAQAGESTLIDLSVDNKSSVKVLVHEIQTNPLTDKFVHIDFYQVNMTEKLETEIPLKFIGESKAVKELAGILEKHIEEIEVKCLPQDLVHEITVDISGLNTFEDVIRIKDIVAPKGIEILNDEKDIVVNVTEPISEEELKALDEKPVENVEAVKVEEKGKKEEEKK